MKPVRDYLQQLKALSASDEAFKRHCYAGLPADQKLKLAGRDIQVYTGKIRDMVYQGDDVQVVHSDRLTAFDNLIAHVPYKGTILTAISEYWFQEAAKVVPTHYKARPHERILLAEKREPVKAEVIVRGYLAGSMMRAYAKGERNFCGVSLPDGLKPYQKLPKLIITPTTKAAAFEHDEDTTPEDIIGQGIATLQEWEEISSMALKLFAHGTKVLSEKGWILVDTKYEFGRGKNGSLAVIDEVHTPDCSRFWNQETYSIKIAAGNAPDMLDKEIVRRWLADRGYSGEGVVPEIPANVLIDFAMVYLDVAETLCGEPIMTAGPDQHVAI